MPANDFLMTAPSKTSRRKARHMSSLRVMRKNWANWCRAWQVSLLLFDCSLVKGVFAQDLSDLNITLLPFLLAQVTRRFLRVNASEKERVYETIDAQSVLGSRGIDGPGLDRHAAGLRGACR